MRTDPVSLRALRAGALTAMALPLLALAHLLGTAGSTGRGCIAVVGRGAELGARLAMLHADPSCPGGSMAMTRAAVGLLLGVLAVAALATLAVAGLLFAGLGALRFTEHTWTAMLAAFADVAARAPRLHRLLALMLTRPEPPQGRLPRTGPDDVRPLPQAQWQPSGPSLRGPPRGAASLA